MVGPYADYGSDGNSSDTASSASSSNTSSTASASNAAGSLSAELTRINSNSNSTSAATVVLKGCGYNGGDTAGFAAAVAAVKDADTVVLAMGTDGSQVVGGY